MSNPIALKGAPGSPYTRKMLSVLRYRHIPYRYLIGSAAEKAGMPKPAVELLPTFYLPDAEGELVAVTDSTPLIRRFEREYAGRSVLPLHPVMRFLDSLLEDFSDEWLTKAMFHYRWHYPEDIANAGQIIPLQYAGITMPEKALEAYGGQFAARQHGRLGVVGSNPSTFKQIEAGYTRLLTLLDAHFRHYPFLLGRRPAAADFALFGQLSQLTHFDQTSAALTMATSRRVFAWVPLMEDLSGLDPQDQDWLTPDELPETLGQLLAEVGRGYLPVMLANAKALLHGDDEVHAVVEGQPWVQKPVSYQGKCLRWLREEFDALTAADKTLAMKILEQHGCAALVQPPPRP